MTNILRGAAAGAAATVAMTVHMVRLRCADRIDALGPEHITDAAFDAASIQPTTGQHVAGTTVAHLGFGATMGAMGAAVAGGRRLRWWTGTAYGLAIAAASYQGWVPALRILPPLTDAPSGRRREVLVSHVVYGNVLVWLLRRSSEARGDGEPLDVSAA